MKYKIGIFGSAAAGSATITTDVKQLAEQVGQALAKHKDEVIVITGGCSGLPYTAAHETAQHGVEVWGYSPVLGMEEQKDFTPNDDLSIYTKLHFVPKDLDAIDTRRKRMKYRNVLSTEACDASIIISGQWGSLNEFTNLIDMQKTVGVLTGTGGIADELSHLTAKIHKEGQGEVVFESDPEKLIEILLARLTNSH